MKKETLIILTIGITVLLLLIFFLAKTYDEDDITYTTGILNDIDIEYTHVGKSISTSVFFELDNGMRFYYPGIDDDELDAFIGKEVTIGYVYRSELFHPFMLNRTVYFSSNDVVYQSLSDYNRRMIVGYVVIAAVTAFFCLIVNICDIIEFFQKRKEEMLRQKKRAAKKKKKAELRKKYEQLNNDKER